MITPTRIVEPGLYKELIHLAVDVTQARSASSHHSTPPPAFLLGFPGAFAANLQLQMDLLQIFWPAMPCVSRICTWCCDVLSPAEPYNVGHVQ